VRGVELGPAGGAAKTSTAKVRPMMLLPIV
jgi:hypothetical protein